MDPEQEQQLGILHKASQLYFVFFSDPMTQHGSAIHGPNTDSDGCLFFQHRDRDSGSSFIYYIFRRRLGASLYVGLPVRLFVRLSVQVCMFLRFFVLQCSDRDPGSSLIYYIYLQFAAGTDPL